MEVDHWFQKVSNILETMEIISDAMRIRLAAFQLEGKSQVWWDCVKASRNLGVMTWEEFRELFMGKYFPASAQHAKAQEFLELKQGTMTVLEYVANFNELARFADDYMATNMAKVRKFEDGLKLSIWNKIVGLLLQTWTLWSRQLWLLRGRWMMHGASEMRLLKIRGRRFNHFLLAQGRSRRLLLHKGLRDRAATIRTKARSIILRLERL